jgi:general L-amino acid transport system substrate-binding protein
MKRSLLSLALGAAVSIAGVTAATAGTLDDVRSKDFIQCGVSQGLIGFSNPDDKNNWTGLDVDFCRAVAAAVFGDAQKVKFSPLSAKERFTALQSGEIDVLSRNTTWTMSRDTSSAWCSLASTTMTARASWCASRSASIRLCSFRALRSACRPAPPPSST